MKLAIRNDVVRKNIELLQLLVKRQSLQEIGKDKLVLHAFVNRKTGDIFFAGKEEQKKEKESWKPICLQIQIIPGEKEAAFEIIDEETYESLQYKDLAPLAYGIMTETVHVLNDLAAKLSQKTVGSILEEFSQCEITGIKPSIPQDLVHDAWHQTDRLGAEDLLKDCSIGTFLFRKDEYAALLEEEFMHRGVDASCFTLTYLEANDKVTDKTIVKKGEKWLFYDDDPTLSGPNYPSVYSLLATLKKELKEPLLF